MDTRVNGMVMIVEDNDFFRKSFAKVLEMYLPNLNIIECKDAVTAEEKMQSEIPDIMFLDIRLPKKNGLEILKEVKAIYPDMVVVIFTNYDIPEYRQAAQIYGANDFWLKDILSGAEIACRIEHWLKNKRQQTA